MNKIQELIKKAEDKVNSTMLSNIRKTEINLILLEIQKEAINYTRCCESNSEQLKDKEILDFDEWQIANYNLVNFGLYKCKETGDLDSKKGLLNKYCRYRENL